MDDLRTEMKKEIEDKHKIILRVMRKETIESCKSEIHERLLVPDLVGKNCPYSDLATYLS